VAIIISSILTIFLVGLSTGGLLVSRRIGPHQTIFVVVGLAYFLFFYIGMFIGSRFLGFISHGVISIVLGIFCLALIGFLVWKYDPAFGYVKQEPVSLTVFIAFFLLLGMELAVAEMSMWFTLFGTVIFSGGLYLGFMFIYQIVHHYRTPQIMALIPLIPLLFIGLFKLI
jgi:hypothetical protein